MVLTYLHFRILKFPLNGSRWIGSWLWCQDPNWRPQNAHHSQDAQEGEALDLDVVNDGAMAWKTTVPLVYLGKPVALPWFQLLVGHWAYPSEKYEFVKWDKHVPKIWKAIKKNPWFQSHPRICLLLSQRHPKWFGSHPRRWSKCPAASKIPAASLDRWSQPHNLP